MKSNLREYPPLVPFAAVPRRVLRSRDRSEVPPMTDDEIRAAVAMREYGRTWRWIANQLNEERPYRDRLDRREVAREVQARHGHVPRGAEARS